uniref:Uncharacterized protein n=1 Tax=Meloidogyne javanica TaxID=6303 RepID=A0A915LQG3_MELJA
MSTKLIKLIQLFLFFVFIIEIVNCGNCGCGGVDVLDDDNDGEDVGAEPNLGQNQPAVQHFDPNQEEEEDGNQIPDAPEDFEFFANGGEQNLPALLQQPVADVEGFDEVTSGTTPGLTPQGGSTKGSTSSSP